MIITDEKILRLPCVDAKLEEVDEIIKLLEMELFNSERLGSPGIGLSAPQINIQKNIAIIRLNDIKINLVNCKINKTYDKFLFKDEGCLSFKNRIENTMRYREIHIIDNLIYPYSFTVSGLASVVCQHELDHLNGILLPDNAIVETKKVKVRPNDKCICGKIDPITKSVLKYKRCCGK